MTSDKEMLDWIEAQHFTLSAVKESDGEEVALWWQVTDKRKSISGHVLPTARMAIEEAMRRTAGVKGMPAAEFMALVGQLEAAVFATDGDPSHPEVVKARDAVRSAYGVQEVDRG